MPVQCNTPRSFGSAPDERSASRLFSSRYFLWGGEVFGARRPWLHNEGSPLIRDVPRAMGHTRTSSALPFECGRAKRLYGVVRCPVDMDSRLAFSWHAFLELERTRSVRSACPLCTLRVLSEG